MKKSQWLVAQKFYIHKRGRRLLVETGLGKGEVSLPVIDLLAAMGEGRFSSDAIELFCREGVDLVYIRGQTHFWLGCGYRRGVEYLLGQHRLLGHLSGVALETYFSSAADFLERVGSGEKDFVRYYSSYRDRLDALEKTELVVLTEIYERIPDREIGYDAFLDKYRLYRLFLEAEVVSALLRAGLEPSLEYMGLPFYRIAALEFHPPLLWTALLGLRRPDADTPRRWLIQFKSRVDGLLEYMGRHVYARKAIQSRARGYASACVNEKAVLRPLRWFG